jgi:hypothetical protein
MVSLEDTLWNKKAREKLKLPLTGQLTEEQAGQVRVEAGKLKAASIIKAMNPANIVSGMQLYNDEIQITMDASDGSR